MLVSPSRWQALKNAIASMGLTKKQFARRQERAAWRFLPSDRVRQGKPGTRALRRSFARANGILRDWRNGKRPV